MIPVFICIMQLSNEVIRNFRILEILCIKIIYVILCKDFKRLILIFYKINTTKFHIIA